MSNFENTTAFVAQPEEYKEKPQFCVAQLGARMHYAVPRILNQAGMLDRFVTDICSVKGFSVIAGVIPKKLRPVQIKRLLDRVPQGVQKEKVYTNSMFGLRYYMRRLNAKNVSDVTMARLWAGEKFGKLVSKNGFGSASDLYVFNSEALEMLECARKVGVKTYLEQTIAPREIGVRLLEEEWSHFSGWQDPIQKDIFFEKFVERERAEWEEADFIICGSDYVRDSINICTGLNKKCVVVPYGVDSRFHVNKGCIHDGPLRVLTIGEVGLRKGTPYVLDAAKYLKSSAIFRMVGQISVSSKLQAELRSHVELCGPVPRSEVRFHYEWADVFLLPSLWEGSATVIYEALSAGLPVICTPNTGSIVRDSIDGFIVPIRDTAAIVNRLERFIGREDFYKLMAKNAFQRSKEFSISEYSKRLISVLRRD